MHELIGSFVISRSGRDAGKYYVIIDMHNEYVYLVDGYFRTLEHPKKKKLKHVIRLVSVNSLLAEKVTKKAVKNEEIKRAIKLLQIEILNKEVE